MKAFLVGALALLPGLAAAQDNHAACLSFCDADAKTCREGEHPVAWGVADALLHLNGRPSVFPEDRDKAQADSDRDRLAHSRACSDARQVCRQKCAAPMAIAAPAPVGPVAASAASAP